jgi:hypothetical protein
MDVMSSRLRSSDLRDASALADLLDAGEYRLVPGETTSVPVAGLLPTYSTRAEHLASLADGYAQRLAGSVAEFVALLVLEPGDALLRGMTFRAGVDHFETYLVWEAEDGRIIGCMKVEPQNTAVSKSEWATYRGWS